MPQPQLEIDGTEKPKNEPDKAPSQKATLGLTGDKSQEEIRAEHAKEFEEKTVAADKAKAGEEIKGALEVANKTKEEGDRLNAAIVANKSSEPVEVTKPTDPSQQGTKGGKMKTKGGDPVTPPTFLSMGISSDIWNIGFGPFLAIYAFLRGKWKTKTDGMVDKKGQRAEQFFSNILDPTTELIQGAHKLGKYIANGKKTDPLTEEHISQAHNADPVKQLPTNTNGGILSKISDEFKKLGESAFDLPKTSDQQSTPIVFSNALNPSSSLASVANPATKSSNSFDPTRGTPVTSSAPASKKPKP